ncbi:MAG: FAD-dependent oxidoreductase [Desulfobacteraceae bacterium]|nr:FAD-dependent oxidoreductase [Desulfobacteraceae bacterium]MBC2754334.1 FAD-dependent oxidoreductase [Desulfobacteraceae bacterium]
MEPTHDHENEPSQQKIEKELKQVFDQIPEEIPIYLFAQPGKNDVFADTARQAIQYFGQLTNKVVLHEFDLDHDQAKKWNIENSPTILIDPDHYNIQWLGAPIGEESRIFIETLIFVGFKKTGIGQQSLNVLNQIKDKRAIKLFVSPSCPYCPQQAVNALKAAVEKPDLISLEIIDIQANPEIARQYDAQSVPQTYANETLVALGAQQEELFMLSLQKMEQQTMFIPDNDAEEIETDLVIVGGGPAGLSAGIYAARSGLKSVILERNILGGQVATTPVVENYPGLTQIGGKNLVEILVTHALQYVQIFQGEEVMAISQNHPMTITTNKRRFITRAMLLATGATHKHLEVPGESRLSGRGVSYCSTCDGPLFAGQKVLMIGGGDSAVTEALHLKNIGVDVTLIHLTDKLDAQEVLAGQLIRSGIPILYNTVVKEILGKKSVDAVTVFNSRTNETKQIETAGVFIAIGYLPSVDLADKIGVEKTSEGFIQQESYRTNVSGVYAAGDVVGGYNQIVTASGHGAEAALTIFRDLLNYKTD